MPVYDNTVTSPVHPLSFCAVFFQRKQPPQLQPEHNILKKNKCSLKNKILANAILNTRMNKRLKMNIKYECQKRLRKR